MIYDATVNLEIDAGDLAAVFTEWQRRYRADPDGYMDSVKVGGLDATDYGQLCAAYLMKLARELAGESKAD